MKRHFWIFAGLTLGWMAFIFYMSAQGTTESAQNSAGITSFVAELFYGKGVALTEAMLQPVTLLVRKTAHMAAYAILFLLSYGTVYYCKKTFSVKWMWLFAYGWTVFYAVTDEIHQIFSGRGALVADVVIDAFGALIGTVLLFGVRKVLSAKGAWGKLGWVATSLVGAFGIYALTFVFFHRDVIELFFQNF